MLRKIKGAIFDMDGTLIDSLMFWDFLWERLGEKYFNDKTFRPSESDDKTVRTLTLKASMEFIYGKYNIGPDAEELYTFTCDMIRDFYSNTVKAKEGVCEFLQYCFDNNIKMCIASATDTELVKIAMKHCGIDKFIDKIFSCCESQKGKECPEVFLSAINYLGYDVSEICVFEDSQVAIETAHKLGVNIVGVYDKYNYGQDIIRKYSTVYIEDGKSLMDLVR